MAGAPPQPGQNRQLGGITNGAFVGRKREMSELKAALEDVLAGQGRLVMLSGEPGIGKTRTALELAAHATQRGATVLWGRCHADEGAPPYWPWVHVIRSYVREHSAEQLRSEMGAGAADIAEVVSEVKERMPDLKPPPALDSSAQARFRLFDSITTFLKQASSDQPLVLVMDNLHWADRPSLQLLEFLAQELAESQLLVLGTYRDAELSRGHPLTQALGELAREPVFRRIPLGGLSEEEVGRFIELTSGFAPPRDLAGAVHSRTEGSPLFITEVVRLLVQEGELTPERVMEREDWSIQIPVGVHEVIGRRLDRLSERCNRILTVAAVVGREFELELLERLMGDPATSSDGGLEWEELLESMEEALAAGVIEELPPAVSRYQFAHVLIQDTLATEMSAARRARLHQQIAEAQEGLWTDDLEAHAPELAYHFAEAVTIAGTEKLVRYSLLAGEQALATYAHEQALVQFERALAAKESQPMDAETAALLFGRGRAQIATLQRREALASIGRAFDYYVESGDVPSAVSVAQYPINPGIGRMRVTQLIGRALELVPPDSHEAGRLLSRYGLSLSHEMADYQGAHEAFDRARAIAQREGDVALEMRTLASASWADMFHLQFRQSLENSLRACELATEADDLQAEVNSRFGALCALIYLGDREGAAYLHQTMLAAAERLRDRGWLSVALWLNQIGTQMQGDWPSSRDLSDRGLAMAPRDAKLLFTRALLEFELGDFDQGEAYLERLLEAMSHSAPGPTFEYWFTALAIPMVARITGDFHRLDIAETTAAAVLSSSSVVPLFAVSARAGLALLAVLRSDVTLAGQQYEVLQTWRGTVLSGAAMAVDRLLGLLAQTMGRFDDAADHFEDALSFCHQAGYRPEYAWSASDYAGVLLQRHTPGDLAKASPLLEESLAIARELGMRPLIERAMASQERVGSRPREIPVYPDGLSPGEAEVLCLIAFGKSNREIAEDLVLSVRTVERHITNIYGKINARGRAEATAYALNHQLTNYT